MESEFRAMFEHDPYNFQIDTARHLLGGRHVLLQAPTGAGKTWGALFPFLYAKLHGLPFADRLIYALPLRTLAVALKRDAEKKVAAMGLDLKVTIQTGDMPEDSLFDEGDIIFTTIDQTLSSYIGVPVSLPRKTANLPAAAAIGAYVVFDEFHLLEPARALATALDLVDRLQSLSRVLLMSATVPKQAVSAIARRMRAAVVEVDEAAVATIPSQKDKDRTFYWHDTALTVDAILAAHTSKTIVVVNRVVRAQDLFRELLQRLDGAVDPPELLLLHARFLQRDRAATEARIIHHFKQGGEGRAILVATQVVEVGLDISADVLHTDLAPANSVFQRAGRCARYPTEHGAVHVYALPLNDQGESIYGPYLKEDRGIVDATARELAAADGRSIGFVDERAIIDRVHADVDLKRLSAVTATNRRTDVVEAMRTGNPDWVRRLVREVDAVSVIVHDAPESLCLNLRPESLSVSRSVLYGFVASLDLTGTDSGSVQIPVFDRVGDNEGPDVVRWTSVGSSNDLKGAIYVAIMPTHADYDSRLGLLLEPQASPSSYRAVETRSSADLAFTPYSYVRETYDHHVGLVVAQSDARATTSAVATERLASAFGVGRTELESWCALVAALHDIAKLADGWQQAVWNWQEDIHKEKRSGYLAHTQYDASNEWQRDRQRENRFRKPPHAVEGAWAALPAIAAAVEKTSVANHHVERVAFAMATAIARHHSAFAENMDAFRLGADARREAARCASLDPDAFDVQDAPSAADRSTFGHCLTSPTDPDAFLLYWYLARRLRISDQTATRLSGDAQ